MITRKLKSSELTDHIAGVPFKARYVPPGAVEVELGHPDYARLLWLFNPDHIDQTIEFFQAVRKEMFFS